MKLSRKKIYAAFGIFALLYLAIHFLIFDKGFKYTGLTDFISEGREHIWHVAPVIIVFFVLLAKDLYERMKKRRSDALDTERGTAQKTEKQ